MTPEQRLRRLFAPSSIVVVGASTKRGYGRSTLANLRRLGFDGPLAAVHPTADEVEGVPVYRSLRDVPFVPDAVAIAIPAAQVPAVVRESAELGVGGAVVYASGFRECGQEGRDLEAAVRAAAGDRVAVLGPNCLGLVNYGAGSAMWGIEMPRHQQSGGGSVAIASQSGAMLITTLLSGRLPDVAFAASIGNQADVDLNDVVEYALADPQVQSVCLITEGIDDLERFRRLADQARVAGVAVIVLKLGRSARARAASVAHTGTLAGDDDVFQAAVEQSGALRVDDLDELVAACSLVTHVPVLPVGGLAVFATSGGEGGLVADVAEAVETRLAPLDRATEERLAELVPPFGSVGNPFDLTAGAWGDADVYRQVTEALANCPSVGMIAMIGDAPHYLGDIASSGWEQMLAGAGQAARECGVPVAVITTTTDVGAEFKALADRHGVLLLAGVRPALRAISLAQSIPGPQNGRLGPTDVDGLEDQVASARNLIGGRTGALAESDSKNVIARFGIAVPDGGQHRDVDELARIADTIGYPVVCKVAGVAHKSDVGGVIVGIGDEEHLRIAYDRIQTSVPSSGSGPHEIRVERMLPDGLEIIVGGRRSDAGVSVVVGAGGVLTEVLKDARTLVWPFDATDVVRALARLRIAPLLGGYRGSSAVDQQELAALVVRAGQLLAALPEVVEMDLNPVLAGPDGCVAADALIVVGDRQRERTDQ